MSNLTPKDTRDNLLTPERVVAPAPMDGVSPLPCLNSNISTEPVPLSTQNRKTAFLLSESVQTLAAIHGLGNLGFLTLTFAEHILCPKEAQRRLNSLISHVIKVRYLDYVGVFERQKSGRIHYHLLVVLPRDIRQGIDFTQVLSGDYKSANSYLRSEWSFWRKTAKAYRFGRTELMPVRSTAEAIGKYVGKYISKHITTRPESDKGVRLVRYSNGARVGTTRFQFLSTGSAAWRAKIAVFAEIVTAQTGYPVKTISDFSFALNDKRWAHTNREFISSLPVS